MNNNPSSVKIFLQNYGFPKHQIILTFNSLNKTINKKVKT